MAGGNPFMPPGSASPSGMPGANPGGPVGQGQSANRPPQVGRAPFDRAGASLIAPLPAGQQGPNGQGPGQGQPAPPPSLEQVGKMMNNYYKDGMKAQGVLDHLRRELDQLLDYGDMVRPEQVIEAAGRLVGHGIGATQLAQIMSDMPATGGEGLAGLVRMHDVTITNAQAQLSQQNDLIRHQLGMIGMRMLAQQHVQSRVQMHMDAASQAGGQLSPASGGGAMSGLPDMSSMGGNDLSGGVTPGGSGGGNA